MHLVDEVRLRELTISAANGISMELPPARYSPELPHPARTHRSYESSVLINRSRSYAPSQHMRLPISDELLRGHSAASADAVLEAVLRGALSPTQASTTPSFLALMARDLPPAHSASMSRVACAGGKSRAMSARNDGVVDACVGESAPRSTASSTASAAALWPRSSSSLMGKRMPCDGL